MYKSADYDYEQLSFVDFNESCGMQLDHDNEWILHASRLPWKAWEALYAALFPAKIGNVAKPCRMVLGSLILQMRMGFSDRELVNQIQQNPYFQYFVGLKAFQHDAPFVPTLLVEWRKRLDVHFLVKANDILCDAMPGLSLYRGGGKKRRHGTLVATQICDATVAPQNIRFPQDTSLLNEARVKLEDMIDFFCGKYGLEKPRTYRKVAHKEYLTFAKSKKPSADKVRAAVKAQLSYVRRDLEYIDSFMRQGYAPDKKYADNIITIHRLYEQQKYMFDSNVHKVDNRIVSISQPYVRPIMRGKANRPTEFGAKLHLSIDERGFGKQICKEHGIRISGPRLGRPPSDARVIKRDRKTAAVDKIDRIEIERYFSIAKRRNGMGLITKKREDTSLSTIAMSVLVTNIFGSFQEAVQGHHEPKAGAIRGGIR